MSEASIQQLMDDLKAVVSDAEALMAATSGEAGDRVADARRRAAESLGQARERLQGFEKEVGARAKAAADDAERYLRDNPWQSIGVAALVGVLIGLAISRR
jgi:ElaB/YqjD/DUF883 family membrane-anchored ribosome-binding protein